MTKRILLVESDDTVAELVTMILEDAGHAVDRTVNADDGLAHLLACRPDLVLVDLWLTGGGGLSLLRASTRAATAAIPPIVVMAGGDLARADLGAPPDGVVGRPFDLDELLGVVDSAIHRQAVRPGGTPA